MRLIVTGAAGVLGSELIGQTLRADPQAGRHGPFTGDGRGFGLMFWHTAGWIGPIRIEIPTAIT